MFRLCDVNARDSHGNTPLHVAASSNSLKVAALLLNNEVNVNEKCHCGNTPLHSAALQGNVGVADLLIANGANANTRRSYDGKTPLDEAKSNYYAGDPVMISIIECLEKAVQQKQSSEQTASSTKVSDAMVSASQPNRSSILQRT